MKDTDNIFNPFYERMKSTPQSQKWHGEGDVLTHTRMVCEALCSLPDYMDLPSKNQEILLTAAKLHDIGKTATTQKVVGEIESPHHAPIGSRMVRELLWKYGFCGSPELISIREAICQLIRYHSFPPHAIDNDDAAVRLHRIAANGLLVPDFSIRALCILAKVDMIGRICVDKEQMLDQIYLCEELAKDEKCFEGCFRFADEYTMHSYLNGRKVWKDSILYDDTWGTVYMMSGLPGTGKDTWIQKNLPDIPIVSLDEIRKQHKISPTDNQGVVANLAKEQAKEYLRRHQSFVWNATNITQIIRRQLISLFEGYKARVHLIYLETDQQTLLWRNSSRDAVVPQSIIESLLSKIELPEIHEAHQVDWYTI